MKDARYWIVTVLLGLIMAVLPKEGIRRNIIADSVLYMANGLLAYEEGKSKDGKLSTR